MSHSLVAGLENVRRNWGMYLLLGILLSVLGVIAIVYPLLSSVATVVFFGWLIIISGVAEVFTSFQVRDWGGFFLHLLAGIVEIVCGLLVLKAPVGSMAIFTLLFAAYLLVGGLFRMVAAVAMRFPQWGWVAFGGFITAILGVLLVCEWPGASIWFIGTYVGIDLLLHGVSWIMFALGVRRVLPTARAQ